MRIVYLAEIKNSANELIAAEVSFVISNFVITCLAF